MTKFKRMLVMAMTLAIALLFLCPAFVSAADETSNYLYDITDKVYVDSSGIIKQPTASAYGIPLDCTVLVFYGSFSSFAYRYGTNPNSFNINGSVSGVFPSGNVTMVVLDGSDYWAAIKPTDTSLKLMSVYTLVTRQWQDLPGTFTTDFVVGISFDFGTTGAVGLLADTKCGDYGTSRIYIYPSVPAVPFLDKSCITVSGYFTDITAVNADIDYTVTYVHTITLDPSYSVTANGEAISQIQLDGLSHQVGDSVIHDGDLYLQGSYTTAGNMLHVSNTSDIDITVPDSNVSLSGTNTISYEGVTYDVIPSSAISSVYTSATLTFAGTVPDKIVVGVGMLAYADGYSARNVYVTGKYLIGELPNSQTSYQTAIYQTLYSFTGMYWSNFYQYLRNEFTINEKPFYQEWFEKFVSIFDRGADEEAKSDFSQAEDKLNNVSAGLAQTPKVDTGSIEFNAPAFDQDNLLLVVINQAWEVPFFLQCVAVLVGCVVLGFLLFGKRG